MQSRHLYKPHEQQSPRLNFAFDLDGTVSEVEIIPHIATLLSQEAAAEMIKLTQDTVLGFLPFEASFSRRVEILKNLPVDQVREHVGKVSLDANIADFIRSNNDRCIIVTGNLDIWINDLVLPLGCPIVSSKATVQNNFITSITKILDKEEWALAFEYPFVAIGDGHNDLGMLKQSEIGIAFGGVHRPARSLLNVADYLFNDGAKLCQFLKQLL
jgi:phosphoserine phosphatase